MNASSVARTLPTLWRRAGRRFFELGGLPGPERVGFGAPVFACRFLNPLRTGVGVSLFGSVGFFQGLGRSVATRAAAMVERATTKWGGHSASAHSSTNAQSRRIRLK